MLEYFTYKKVKKHKAEKKANEDAKEEAKRHAEASKLTEHARLEDRREKEVIRPDDESFLEELLASDDTPAPPLPPRLYSRELDWPSDNEDASATSQNTASNAHTDTTTNGKGKEKATPATATEQAKKQNRISALFTRHTAKKPDTSDNTGLKPDSAVPVTRGEEEKEKRDLTKVLDRLNLSVKNNKVFATGGSDALVKFTNVFKDLVNGVPTAYDDLMKIIEDKDGALAKGFDKLPSSLKKLVTQLPEKITQSLGPELLAAAAAGQGLKVETSGGMKGAAKKAFLPHNLYQLVTKPGAIVGMLRAIVEVLKTRWPAFIGMNVMWGVALSCKLVSMVQAVRSEVETNVATSAPVCAVVLPQARS